MGRILCRGTGQFGYPKAWLDVATRRTDATLLPTVQNGPLIRATAIRGYFVHFLEKSPQGKIDQRIVHISCNIAYDIGLYTFELDGDQPGTRTKVGARYTFIYAPEGGKWLIVHHHSSSAARVAQTLAVF